jgi:hypothetical protein
MLPIESIPEMVEGGVVKENDDGGEFKYDIFEEHL